MINLLDFPFTVTVGSFFTEASEEIQSGDEVAVDFDTGIITNLTQNKTYQAEPFPEFIKDIIRADGLMNSIGGKQ